MQKQHYFGRNNLHSAEMRIFRSKLLFLSNTAWPGLCIQTGQMCDAGWGRELIYLYGSHTSYWSNVGVEIATAYLFVLPCPKRWSRWRLIWGVLEPEGLEWNKFQLIFCIYNSNIFPSMTGEWQPRPFPFSICYDVIVMCIRDVMPSLLALNFSFYGPTLDVLLNIYHKQCFTSQLHYLLWPK